jgi:hypothetical protein
MSRRMRTLHIPHHRKSTIWRIVGIAAILLLAILLGYKASLSLLILLIVAIGAAALLEHPHWGFLVLILLPFLSG